MTVAELKEKLNKFPEDYKVALHLKYQEVGDFGDGWRTLWTDDIDSIESNDENNTVIIKAWE